jgi:c-di-GMP-binding flagellar brake protein YcgR
MEREDERRRHRRVSLRVAAKVYLGAEREPHQGYLNELSEGGAYFVVTGIQAVGSRAHIRFLIEPDSECESTGRVIRAESRTEGLGVAVKFGYANGSFRFFIRNLQALSNEFEKSDLLADIRNLEIDIQ